MDIEHSFLDIRKSKKIVQCLGIVKSVKLPHNLPLIFHIRLVVHMHILILLDSKLILMEISSQRVKIACHQSKENVI
jgi:hypothetical protein